MSRVIALIGNRPDVCALVMQKYAPLMRVETQGEPLGWGVGLYQHGEALLRRRPMDDRQVIEVAALGTTPADLLLAQIRTPTVGGLRTENTPPFRYRDWMFAQRGTIENFERIRSGLIDVQPDFLRRNVRGDTDGEVMFYSFLSCLHEAVGLDHDRIGAVEIRRALRTAIGSLDKMLAAENTPEARLDWFVTDGEHLVCLHRSGSMMSRTLSTTDELEDFLPESTAAVTFQPFQCSLIASGLPELPAQWRAIKGGTLITLTRTSSPTTEAI
jgi:predicted glutamine amidotransferase